MSDGTQIDRTQGNPDEEWGGWFECDDGWRLLITELHSNLRRLSPDYTLSQVKEKFGGLRYYASPGDVDEQTAAAFYDLIREAEAKSFEVCERCGQAGRLSSRAQQGGWYKTLCPACAEAMNFEQLDDDGD